jgi:NADH:ubiquinone oxidoreductase subunit 5 (subunit L)/multisubunit Na+/H+ antiporter MnhA subunit
MEAPIPASALIHSATLVSAGVYIILRLINYIVVWPFLINLILLATTVTLLFFCPIILMQTDLKKLLALSTIVNISFLYLMVVSLNNSIVCFYFVVHGLFKSCSFLFVGCFILINAHSQDHRFFKPLSNNNYMIGFLLFICVFFLSGSNILLVYKIKHGFDFKNTCHLYINELISLSF